MTEAKVSTTAFYARFASKEEVLRALVLGMLGDLNAALAEDVASATGLEEGFHRGVEVMCDVLVPRRALVRVTLTEAAASPAVIKALAGLYSALATLLASQLEDLMGRGALAKVDAPAAAWSLIGALQMQVLRWAVYDQLSADAFRKALHDVADSYLPALRPAAAGAPKTRRSRPRSS
jgi:AcrR family transcriptional regulator